MHSSYFLFFKKIVKEIQLYSSSHNRKIALKCGLFNKKKNKNNIMDINHRVKPIISFSNYLLENENFGQF